MMLDLLWNLEALLHLPLPPVSSATTSGSAFDDVDVDKDDCDGRLR